MEDQLAAFLDYLEHESHYSENTIAAYRNDLTQFLNWLADYPKLNSWANVDAPTVAQYVEEIKEQPYASSSVARKVAAVKSFFHYLFARAILDEDPTANLDSPKVKKRLPKTLTADDVERLLEAPRKRKGPKNLRDSALLALLYATGMRVTEVVSLTLSDIDLDASVLYCAGKDGARELPFDRDTRRLLQLYLEEGRPHLVKDKNETALFLNHRGQQLTRQGLWLIIKAYANQAELSGEVTPHTLRHSFAAHRLTNGSDLREVQQLLGHANISTTQIYTQLTAENEQEEEEGEPEAV
jgi:integrase/recombinase XerD